MYKSCKNEGVQVGGGPLQAWIYVSDNVNVAKDVPRCVGCVIWEA